MTNKLMRLIKKVDSKGVQLMAADTAATAVSFAKQNSLKFIGRFALAIISIAGLSFYALQQQGLYAATAGIVPNSDVTTDFAAQTGCTSAAHYSCVDDGSDATYVNTGTSGSGGEVEEYGLTTVSAVDSASQVDVTVRARRLSTGSDPDSIDINLRIGGSLQTAATRTPGTSWGDLTTVSFTGSWTQADIDGAQVYISRTVNGGGNPNGRDDDIGISNITATVDYVSAITFEQSAYRWFENADSADVGTPLAAQDTAATAAAENEPFRLRQNIHVGASTLSLSDQNLKLQYAEQSGTCDTSFSGELYTDVDSDSVDSFTQTYQADSVSFYASTGSSWTNTSNAITEDGTTASSSPFGGDGRTDTLEFGFTPTLSSGTIDNITQVRLYVRANAVSLDPSAFYAESTASWTGSTLFSSGLTASLAYASATSSVASSAEYADFETGGTLFARTAIVNGSLNTSDVNLDHIYIEVDYEVDVPASTLIAFYDNATPSNGDVLTDNANDPTDDAHTNANQAYVEQNNFSNSVSSITNGSDGLWDFALRDNGAPPDTTYCFRIVKADNSLLNTYTVIPEITTRTPTLSQENFRWYENQNNIDPSNVRGDQNTPVVVDFGGEDLRFRQYVGVSDKSVSTIKQLKMQHALVGQDGVCDASFTGETYSDNVELTLASTSQSADPTSPTGVITEGDGQTTSNSAGTTGTSVRATFAANQFSIPSYAVIKGIEITADATGNPAPGNVSFVTDGGRVPAFSGESHSLTGIETVGSSTYLWGQSEGDLLPSYFNNEFTVDVATGISVTGSSITVDYVGVTIYYEAAVAGTTNGFSSFDNTGVNDGESLSGTFGSNPQLGGFADGGGTYKDDQSIPSFFSSVTVGSALLYDFAIDTSTVTPGRYCLRLVEVDGTLLDTYSQIPYIDIAPNAEQYLRGGNSIINGTEGTRR